MDSLPIVVPVRFLGGGLSMQTTTSRMNLESAFIRCMVSPKEGAVIALQLALPTALHPVELAGTVKGLILAGGQGKDAGFWVVFGEMKPGAREHLETFLSSKRAGRTRSLVAPAGPSPKSPPSEPAGSKRSFPRVATRLQVSWASPREFLVAYSENLSRGGIFVATPNPPPLRETVELLLELPDGKGPVRTQAEVVQRVTAEEAGTRRVAGAGLQFVGSDDEFRQRLDACIEQLLTGG